jgi:hypothetical protein
MYLSKSTGNTDVVDLGDLKSIDGTFYYSFDPSTNTNDYKYVLIWCKGFSVLFGNGALQS